MRFYKMGLHFVVGCYKLLVEEVGFSVPFMVCV